MLVNLLHFQPNPVFQVLHSSLFICFRPSTLQPLTVISHLTFQLLPLFQSTFTKLRHCSALRSAFHCSLYLVPPSSVSLPSRLYNTGKFFFKSPFSSCRPCLPLYNNKTRTFPSQSIPSLPYAAQSLQPVPKLSLPLHSLVMFPCSSTFILFLSVALPKV